MGHQTTHDKCPPWMLGGVNIINDTHAESKKANLDGKGKEEEKIITLLARTDETFELATHLHRPLETTVTRPIFRTTVHLLGWPISWRRTTIKPNVCDTATGK